MLDTHLSNKLRLIQNSTHLVRLLPIDNIIICVHTYLFAANLHNVLFSHTHILFLLDFWIAVGIECQISNQYGDA